MNRKLISLFVVSFVAIGLSGFIGWASYTPPKPNHRAVVADSSLSSANERCGDIVKLTGQAIRKPSTNDKTKLVVFSTGDPLTANEPHGLGSFDVPHQVKLTQGNEKLETQKNKILEEVKASCEQIPQAQNSSVFLALKRAVEHLRSLGCDDKSKCEILAQTDLQENADQQIKKALSGVSANPKKLPSPIDNQGIAIKICGISQTKGLVVDRKGAKTQLTQNRNTDRADLIQKYGRSFSRIPSLSLLLRIALISFLIEGY